MRGAPPRRMPAGQSIAEDQAVDALNVDVIDLRRDAEMARVQVNALSSSATERSDSVGVSASTLHVPHGIVVPNLPQVAAYLARHADMRETVQTMAESLVKEFGKSNEITLDLYIDHEIDDQYLSFYVRQSEYADDLMERLEEVSVRYDDALAECSGWVLITTDFRVPRQTHGV